MPEYYIQPVTNRQECYTCHKVVTGKRKLSKCSKCHAITYCSGECQKKDWPRHGWNCVPVMVTEIPFKGQGLVAAKDIKMGELIFIDDPVIEVEGEKMQTGETGAFEIMKKIENLPSEAKLQFYRMKGPDDKSFQDLKSRRGETRATLDVLLANSKKKEQGGFSLYLNMTLVNHSCSPNADHGRLLEKDDAGKLNDRIEIRAIKDICKGEEINYSYFGNILDLCCLRRQGRKVFIKNNFGFDCNCSVCSELNTYQENIAMELLDLLQTLPDPDHYRKGLSEWSRDAENLDKINDLIQDFQLGKFQIKWRSMISLAKTAQLARNQNLVRKGLDMLKRFSEDIKMEQIVWFHKILEEDLTQWSNNLKSKKTPMRNEIEYFLKRNLLTEIEPHKSCYCLKENN